jgi:hypothetical protein
MTPAPSSPLFRRVGVLVFRGYAAAACHAARTALVCSGVGFAPEPLEMRAVIRARRSWVSMSWKGGFGLGSVPGLGVAAGGDAGLAVAVPGVPHDDQGAGEQGERDGALDGAGGAVAGLAGSGDVAGVGEGLLDGPAGGVAGVIRAAASAARSVVTRARTWVSWRARMTRTVRVSRQPYHRRVMPARLMSWSRP